MDCAGGLGFDALEDEGGALSAAADPSPPRGVETELQFLTRRAMEESRLSKHATTPSAAAAHAYLAAAYSAQVAKELAKEAELERLLLQLN